MVIPHRFHSYSSKEEMRLVLLLKNIEQWDMKRIALEQLIGARNELARKSDSSCMRLTSQTLDSNEKTLKRIRYVEAGLLRNECEKIQ